MEQGNDHEKTVTTSIFARGIYNANTERVADLLVATAAQSSPSYLVPAYLPLLIRTNRTESESFYVTPSKETFLDDLKFHEWLAMVRNLVFQRGIDVTVELPWPWMDQSGNYTKLAKRIQKMGCRTSLGHPLTVGGVGVPVLDGWDVVRINVSVLQSGSGVAFVKRCLGEGAVVFVDEINSEIEALMARVSGANLFAGSHFDKPRLAYSLTSG